MIQEVRDFYGCELRRLAPYTNNKPHTNMAQTKILRVTVENVDDSIGGQVHLWFTSATEANKVFRQINRGKHELFGDGEEAVEPYVMDIDTTKRGVVEFLNAYCTEEGL